MGLHAAIIRLSPLIHKGEQRYKPYIVGDPRMVSLLNITSSPCDPPPPPLKNPGYAPGSAVEDNFQGENGEKFSQQNGPSYTYEINK